MEDESRVPVIVLPNIVQGDAPKADAVDDHRTALDEQTLALADAGLHHT